MAELHCAERKVSHCVCEFVDVATLTQGSRACTVGVAHVCASSRVLQYHPPEVREPAPAAPHRKDHKKACQLRSERARSGHRWPCNARAAAAHSHLAPAIAPPSLRISKIQGPFRNQRLKSCPVVCSVFPADAFGIAHKRRVTYAKIAAGRHGGRMTPKMGPSNSPRRPQYGKNIEKARSAVCARRNSQTQAKRAQRTARK